MFDYGKNIQHNGWLDVFCKSKSKLIARWQQVFLKMFDFLTHLPPTDRIFTRISRQLVGSFLYSVKLEINTACSLNCEMCYVEKEELELPLWVIKNFLDQIAANNVRLEILGGEPLLRKDLEDIISYAKQKAKLFFISVYTNGLLADFHRCQQLKQAGLDVAIVTIISHKAKVHDAFTGQQGSWATTIENIGNLKKAGITVYTFTAIHKKNYADYQKIYHFVKQKLQVSPLFYQYIPQNKEDKLMIDPQDWHEIKHWILREKNLDHADFVRQFFMLTGNACSGGNFVFTIKADGSVQPCPFVTDIPLGNIYQDNIWRIFKQRFEIPNLVEFKSLPEECQQCSYRSVCGGGCRAGNRLLFGSYASKDHHCLGPYFTPISKKEVLDCVPSFF